MNEMHRLRSGEAPCAADTGPAVRVRRGFVVFAVTADSFASSQHHDGQTWLPGK